MNHNLIKQTVTFANKKSKDKFTNNEKHQRVRDYYLYTGKYRGALHSICNKYIIKELVKEFEEEFSCLGENTKKCKPFHFQ